MTCIIEVSADVLRTCLQLTRHSSLWMKDVYQSVHSPSESGVTEGAFPYTPACTVRRPVRSTSAEGPGFIEVYGMYALKK